MFYNIRGISLYNTGQPNYKHGFVFIYNNHGLNWLSIKKSKPNNSNELVTFYDFNFG